MKNSALYHTLPTIRKIRRMLRRTSRQAYSDMTKSCGKAYIKLYDSKDRNILKTRRWRNRLMTTKNNISYLGELSMETLE